LPDTILRKTNLLVPNQTEASLLTNIPVRDVGSAKEAARILQSKGAEIVTITLGNVGSVAASGEEVIHTPAFLVDAVDVTGAGDSFCASLAYALMELSDLGPAVRFATASGALSVTRLGAQPSLPTLERINEFLG
jgi:ribokinase